MPDLEAIPELLLCCVEFDSSQNDHYLGMPGIDRAVYGRVVTSAFTQTRKTVTLDGDHSFGQEFDSLHLHH